MVKTEYVRKALVDSYNKHRHLTMLHKIKVNLAFDLRNARRKIVKIEEGIESVNNGITDWCHRNTK